MTAKVEKTSVPRKFLAWCEDCQDGWRGGKPTVSKWADRHNAELHTKEEGK